jgi:hypothetical protein
MVAYATQGDVYRFGLARGALGNPGRLADSSLASTSTITLAEHGFASGDPITVRATAGGVLSSPLVAGTIYYVLRLDDSRFQVSATANGAPITLTTDGVSVMVAADLPFSDVLEFYSRFVDGFLPAHAVPLPTPYPITVVAIVASLAARRLQILSGVTSESMRDEELAAKAQLERWAKGLPVRDAAATTQPANLAVTKQPSRPPRIGVPFFSSSVNGTPSDNDGQFSQ